MRLELVIFENKETFHNRANEFYLHPANTRDAHLLRITDGGLMERLVWKTKQGAYDLKSGINCTSQILIKRTDVKEAFKGWGPHKITTVGVMPEFITISLDRIPNCEVVHFD